MEFIDNVTPSSPSSFYDSLKSIDNKSTWSDKRFQAANDWAQMYYQNAYNTAMQNYMNEYNSPLQQMLRYQEAGLNPFLAANDPGNMGSSHSAAAPRGSFTSPSNVDKVNAVNSAISQVNNTLKSAQQIYDYLTYGRPLQEFNVGIAGNELMKSKFEADSAQALSRTREADMAWSRYWNLGEEGFTEPDFGGKLMSQTPRARYMEMSTERISAQIGQLQSLVNVLYPSQASANDARAALSDYQRQIQEGQKDAILRINTGNESADAILKMICFWLLDRKF